MANDKFKFFIEPSLQEIFRDKDTALPLAGGRIEFYRDVARTEPKPVYKLSGTPADPVYVELPNPLPLTGIGSTSDGVGNDIKIYYFPFDEDGNQDLYFIKVFNASGVEQFSREGWPQQIEPEGSDVIVNDVQNFIENGQFLLRRLFPVDDDSKVTNEVTNIGFGGWIFQKPAAFTSETKITFSRFNDDPVNPASAPRYQLNVLSENPNPAENFNDIKVIYNRVSFLSGKEITLQFEAVSNTGLPVNIDLYTQKNYGVGGSLEVEEFISTFTVLPTSYEKYKFIFTVSEDLGKTFGDNDDDEFRFVFRLPTDSIVDLSSTNYMVVLGSFENNIDYPTTSNYQEISGTLGGSMAMTEVDNADEGTVLTIGENTLTASAQFGVGISNLQWLPGVATGIVSMFAGTVAPEGYFECDGASLDLVGSATSPEIKRLFSVIDVQHGSGVDGWLKDPLFAPGNIVYSAYELGAVIAADPHTSGFTFLVLVPGAVGVRYEIQVTPLDGASITPSSYFEIFPPSGRSTVYWFSVDGIGVAPNPALFPSSLVKEIEVLSGDNISTVTLKMNSQGTAQYMIPDTRGTFIRGWDHGRGFDPDAADRTNRVNPFDVNGDVVGSTQDDSLQDHIHLPPAGRNEYLAVGGPANVGETGGSEFAGSPYTGLIVPGQPVENPARISTETRPVSTYLMFIIKD